MPLLKPGGPGEPCRVSLVLELLKLDFDLSSGQFDGCCHIHIFGTYGSEPSALVFLFIWCNHDLVPPVLRLVILSVGMM